MRGENAQKGFTTTELRDAAIEVTAKLQGTFKDEIGRIQKVNGDLAKLHKANLSQVAQRMLKRVLSIAQTIEGTN